VNTIDPNFFETNIPEAFRQRKIANAESQDKMVEVLPFFHNLILNSNMISQGKWWSARPRRLSWSSRTHLPLHSSNASPLTPCRQQAWQGVLRLQP
jgi:hypothetical protein